MIDNTTHTDDVSPDAMEQIVARARRGSGPADTGTSGAESGKQVNFPTSVKMSDALKMRVQIRASELGMSTSAYFRALAEQDLKNAYSDAPEMVSLQEARDIATRAVDEALGKLSHRAGHAA
ncbi:hypothetical protein [Nocardia carnea]|uniref:hypothetical protein n=1 Tax=Nocardia carnea TaxID=37328 RepID=UPI002458FAED|nr:hypothetical protein [Nocardia carnea]